MSVVRACALLSLLAAAPVRAQVGTWDVVAGGRLRGTIVVAGHVVAPKPIPKIAGTFVLDADGTTLTTESGALGTTCPADVPTPDTAVVWHAARGRRLVLVTTNPSALDAAVSACVDGTVHVKSDRIVVRLSPDGNSFRGEDRVRMSGRLFVERLGRFVGFSAAVTVPIRGVKRAG